MPSAPSKAAEAIVAILIPPACREEVAGDLHERYQSPLHYFADALTAIPYVIASRIRRTSDPQIVLIQAFSFFFAFLAAAWFKDRGFLKLHASLLRLAIPAAVALLGLILEDAYAAPGQRSPRGLARGPLVGVGLSLIAEGALRWFHPALAIPGWTIAYGGVLSLILTYTVRMMLPPLAHQLRGTNVPADWLKAQSPSPGGTKSGLRVIQAITAVVAVMIVATWIANQEAVPRLWIVAPLLLLVFVLLIANQFWKRR